jgi:hypothetical protein
MPSACDKLHGILLYRVVLVFSFSVGISYSAPHHEFVITRAHAIRTTLCYAGLNWGAEPHVNRISKSNEHDDLVDRRCRTSRTV